MSDVRKRINNLSPEQRARFERLLQERSAARAPERGGIVRRSAGQGAPLSFTQQRMWFIDQLGVTGSAYNIPICLRLEGPLDTDALRRALTEIIRRHECLRTTIEQRDGVPAQVVNQASDLPLPVTDLSSLPDGERDAEADRIRRTQGEAPFDLSRDVLLRGRLLRLAERDHLLVLATHHIASDAWSLGVMVTEMSVLYEAFSEGRPSPLPEPHLQYADFAAWQVERLGGDELERHLSYWREHLGTYPPRLELPVDRPRPPRQTYAGDLLDVTLPPGLGERLKALADGEGATLFMVLMAAVYALLRRHTGQDDLVVGTTIAGRNRPETEALIGCFVNTLPLRVGFGGEVSYRELLGRVRAAALGAYEHQDLPFEKLVQELLPQRDPAHSPLVQMTVDLDNTPRRSLEVAGVRVSTSPKPRGIVHFDLALSITSADTDPVTSWEYNTDLFERATVERFAADLVAILETAADAPDTPCSDLVRLSGEDLRRLEAWNDTGAPIPDTTAHAMFAERARTHPEAPAVEHEGRTLSYGELNARANRLAHHLRALGVGREDLVGVCLERTPDMVAALLGVLKAGAAYVPLDPAYPADRLGFMLSDSGVRTLVTQGAPADGLAGHGARLVRLDADRAEILRRPDGDPPPAAPSDLAYAIYTSGSTGRPKAALIEHRALTNYTLSAVAAFGLTPGDRMLQFASLSFDVLVEELFPVLATGATVVLPPRSFLEGRTSLLELAEHERLTVFELPTAYWHEWVNQLDASGAALPASLRRVIVGGERVLPDRLRAWRRLGVPLVHVFGLTETTVTNTVFPVAPAEDPDEGWPNLPIGSPLANNRLYVLDDGGRPVPVGVPGELYIGGAGLARGYHNRPELTRERFVPNPFGEGRLYRTGDVVRRLPTGDLEFLSRKDTQVKVRGFRVEPSEIESELARHPGVGATVVIAREDTPGDRRLVAYLVPTGAGGTGVPELRAFLLERLPAHMVPSSFVELDELPLSPNGKVDRASLPVPAGGRPEGPGSERPGDDAGNGVERALAKIWADVIGLERVGVHDNFFEIGGDSILSIQIVARAAREGIGLTAMDVFHAPTVAEQARIAKQRPGTAAERHAATGPAPTTPVQRWFLEQGFADPHHWNMAVLLRVRGPYGADTLRQALDALLEHHDGLRQRFDPARPDRSEIVPPGEGVPFETVDLGGAGPRKRAEETDAIALRLHTSLDLGSRTVATALITNGPDEDARLLVVAHHLVVDSVSWRVLLTDLLTLCEQGAAGARLELPPGTTPWRAWAQRLARRADVPGAEREHWDRVLRTRPPALPRDRARGSNTVASARTVTVRLDSDRTEALLREVPAAYNTRVDDVLLAALAEALTGWTGSPRHLVELESHGREHDDGVDLSRTVGWFTSVYPVLLETGDGPAATLRATKEHLRSVPDGGIGYGLTRPRGESGSGAEVAFSYFGQFDQVLPEDGPFLLEPPPGVPAESPRGHRPHLFEVSAQITGGSLAVTWRYGAEVHDETTVRRLATLHSTALEELIAHCRSVEGTRYTPSDFSRARLSQAELDSFMSRLNGGNP